VLRGIASVVAGLVLGLVVLFLIFAIPLKGWALFVAILSLLVDVILSGIAARAAMQAALRPELEVSDVQLLGWREAGLPEDPPPPADKVLRFRLSNRGRVAATGVRGRFFFPSARLQPVKVSLPTERFDYTIREETAAGHFIVRLGYPRTLFPDDRTLASDIAVSVRSAGRTSISYELVSAEGGPPSRGEVSLEVTPAT
jgi:hypothetical protein